MSAGITPAARFYYNVGMTMIADKNLSTTSLGRNLRRLRESANISQGKLAEELGIARVTVNRIEQSVRLPDWQLLCKIADFFHVSLDEFRAEKI